MIHLRRSQQYSFGDGLIAEQTSDLWEPWMRQADRVLEDEQLISAVYHALLKRRPKSRTRGRLGTPAEIVLRLLILKHIRNWSFEVVEREVRGNLVYREFTRVGAAKVPDAKSLGRQALALGPEVIEQIHRRMVQLALENRVIEGRRMRVDTTVVETNIHYPTDSGLLGDGTRVLTRLMKKVTVIAGTAGTKMRDRMRSVQRRVMEIGRAARIKGEQGKEKLNGIYTKLLAITARVVRQAKRFSAEIADGIKRSADTRKQAVLAGLKDQIDTMVVRTSQVMQQAKARVFDGDTHVGGKILSVFEPSKSFAKARRANRPSLARW
jgi:IS5 family transposase